MTLQRSLSLLAACLLVAGCRAPVAGDITRYGSMREALRDGQTQGRVALADLALDAGSHGVGALAGLAGEITIDAGTLWISEPDGTGALRTTRAEPGDREATLLFLAQVPAWREHVVERDVPPGELDAYVGQLVDEAGFAADARLPVVVEGPLADLQAHVINGECPVRARLLGQPLTRPLHEFRSGALQARLVGFFAREGGHDLTHAGSSTHLHAVWQQDGRPATGHVESVGLAPGAVIRLPAG